MAAQPHLLGRLKTVASRERETGLTARKYVVETQGSYYDKLSYIGKCRRKELGPEFGWELCMAGRNNEERIRPMNYARLSELDGNGVLVQAGCKLVRGDLEDDIRGRASVNLDDTALLLVAVDDGHAGLDKSLEPLLDALSVVVGSTTRLASLEESSLHDGFGAIIKENGASAAHSLLKLLGLVHLAGEAIDEESTLCGALALHRLTHSVLEELDGDLHRDNGAVPDAVVDEGAKLAPGAGLFSTEQITGGEVNEAVFLHQTGALRALSGTGAAEDEDDGYIRVVEPGRRRDGLRLGSREASLDAGIHLCGERGVSS